MKVFYPVVLTFGCSKTDCKHKKPEPPTAETKPDSLTQATPPVTTTRSVPQAQQQSNVPKKKPENVLQSILNWFKSFWDNLMGLFTGQPDVEQRKEVKS